MEIYRITIKKGKKKLAVFEFAAGYADDAVNAACDIFFRETNNFVTETDDIKYIAECMGEYKGTVMQLISRNILVRR